MKVSCTVSLARWAVSFALAVDGEGNAYLAGATASTNFPVTTNAFSTRIGGSAFFGTYPYDAFVTKLDAGGSGLLYSTYLGGSQADVANSIAVDGSGRIYVAGATSSLDFPTNAATTVFRGLSEAFVTKLDITAGTNLVYSTYLGGSGNDYALGLGVDTSGQAVVAGLTASIDFPVTNALQTNFAGGPYDGFVAKLSADGATWIFSTYFGGSDDDEISRLALDPAGNIYITGSSGSTNLPIANALYPTNSGFVDAFVTKLDPSGTNLIYSTYLGGGLNDEGWSIAVDTNLNVYVVGRTVSTNFPTVEPYQPASGGVSDVFVARLNSGGTALDYSTYLGSAYADEGYGIAVDAVGNAYITGTTASTNFPAYPTTNGLQTAIGGGGDGFVARLFPRAAALRAELSGPNDVTILWPYGLPGFELQSAGSLNETNVQWAPVTNSPAVVGDDNALTYSNSTDNLFFRLRRTQ